MGEIIIGTSGFQFGDWKGTGAALIRRLIMRPISLIIRICLFVMASIVLVNYAHATKPNESYIYQIPGIPKSDEVKPAQVTGQIEEANKLFLKLYQENPTLAEELGRLPEFLYGDISGIVVEALEDIIEIYNMKSTYPEIDKFFKGALNEGKPEVRAYCSFLRLLFFAAEKDESDYIVKDIISQKRSCSRMYKFVEDKIDSLEYKEKIKLFNSPFLIYLLTYNMQYEYYIKSRKSDKEVIKSKMSNCKDRSELIVNLLKKAGWKKSGMMLVESSIPEGHVIAYYKGEGTNGYKDEAAKYFLIDTGRRNPCKNILGPFNDYREIPYTFRRFLY